LGGALLEGASGTNGWDSTLGVEFYGTLPVLRRAIPKFQAISWLMREILDTQIRDRPNRINPRVVKKPRSRFPSKKRYHLHQGIPRQQLTLTISNST
jgi:hypothetical protein